MPMLLDCDIEEAQRVILAEPLHHGESNRVFIAMAVRAAQPGVQLGEEASSLRCLFRSFNCCVTNTSGLK